MNRMIVSTEIENTRKYQAEITELKNTCTEKYIAGDQQQVRRSQKKELTNSNTRQWNSSNQRSKKKKKFKK